MYLSTSLEPFFKHYAPKDAIAMLKEAGFTALDYSFFNYPTHAPDMEEHYRAIRSYAEENGILFNQAHAPFPSSRGVPEQDADILQNIVRSMKYASLLGIPRIVVHPVQHLTYADPGVPEKLFEMNLVFYNRLKPYCEEYGIQVALENMWQGKTLVGRSDMRIIPSTCSSPAEFIRYLDALDSPCFTACLDLGHTMLVHEDTSDFIRALGHDRLKALHVHDTDGARDLHTLPYYGGMGYWDRITKALADIDYTGDVTFECENFIFPLPAELYPAGARFMAAVGNQLIAMIEENKRKNA